MKLLKKVLVICGIVLLVGVLAFVGLILFIMFGTNTYQTDDIAFYQALSGETEGPNSLAILGEQIDIPSPPYELPYLEGLEPYDDYRFNYTARRVSIFEAHAYTLIVEYSAAYAEKKADLDSQFIWLTDSIPNDNGGTAPEFEMDGFSFRAVKGGWYPKEMLYIGFSDERNEIAYIYIYDFDLDYVSSTVKDYLLEESGWCEVVK